MTARARWPDGVVEVVLDATLHHRDRSPRATPDPMSGEVFGFRNRGGTALEAHDWGANRFVLVYKRLERGCFRFPEDRPRREWRLDRQKVGSAVATDRAYHGLGPVASR